MKEFFEDIKEIKYEGPKSKNPLAFKFYDKDRMILGKKWASIYHLQWLGGIT